MDRQVKHALVLVEWDDHHSTPGWSNADDVQHSPTTCTTVGWLLRDDAAGITVYNTFSESEQIGGPHFIMRSGVRKVTVLRKVRKLKEGTICDKPPLVSS